VEKPGFEDESDLMAWVKRLVMWARYPIVAAIALTTGLSWDTDALIIRDSR
jgi:hypothetical protein